MQILRYFANLMSAELRRSETERVPQALPILILTGFNPNYRFESWRELFPIGRGCEKYQADFPIKVINLTDLYRQNQIKGGSLLRMGCSALGCAGMRRVVEDRQELFKLISDFARDPLIGKESRRRLQTATVAYCGATGSIFNNMTRPQFVELATGAPSGKPGTQWTGRYSSYLREEVTKRSRTKGLKNRDTSDSSRICATS